jgi:hypothetical protein
VSFVRCKHHKIAVGTSCAPDDGLLHMVLELL